MLLAANDKRRSIPRNPSGKGCSVKPCATVLLYLLGMFFTAGRLCAADVVSLKELSRSWTDYRSEAAGLNQLHYTLEHILHVPGGADQSVTTAFDFDRRGTLSKFRTNKGNGASSYTVANDRYVFTLTDRKGAGNARFEMKSVDLLTENPVSPDTLARVESSTDVWQFANGLDSISCSVRVLEVACCKIDSIANTPEGFVEVKFHMERNVMIGDVSEGLDQRVAKHVMQLCRYYPEGRYLLDPRRNHAIVEAEGRNSLAGTVDVTKFDDYRRVEGRCWYPFKVVRTLSKKDQKSVTTIETAQMISFAIPDESEFYLPKYGIAEPDPIRK